MPTLVAGHDYPRTYREFVTMFPDNVACAAYLERLRWPSGDRSPACGELSATPWRHTRGRLVCPVCRHQTTVTTGTIMEKTRTPLTTWFEAAWHLTTAKNGMSAKTFERTLGINYSKGWMILQRFRVAMVRSERERLSGEIEVDETLVGGIDHGGKSGRGAKKCVVVIAVEIQQPKGFGRVRMRYVTDASKDSLVTFVCDVTIPDSVVMTDGFRSYNGLSEYGYTHQRTVLSTSGDPAHVAMPGVHRVASLLKRWILGTHQGSVESVHLQSYLEEYTFRFNRRASRSRGLVFRRLLEQSVVTKPLVEANIAKGYSWETRRS